MLPRSASFLPALSALALWLLGGAAGAPPAPAAGDPLVVPLASKLQANSSMGLFQPFPEVNDLAAQGGALAPLAAGVVQTDSVHGTLTHVIDGAAQFAGPRSGTVDLSYVRTDTKTNGTSVNFGGSVLFRYDFHVDVPTTLTVDWDVLATESFPGNSWWALQGFDVVVNGSQEDICFSCMWFLPPKPSSPQALQGTFTFALPAGDGYLEICDGSAATGNQYASVRTSVGRFGWRIGPPVELLDLGFGLAGTHGEPQLAGTGSLVGGAPLVLVLGSALENVPSYLVVGFGQLGAPFKGGVLVPAVDLLLAGLPTGPGGQLSLETTWPLGLPPVFALYFQFWLPDPAGPAGFAASNGLAAIVP